ncbi:MAG: LytTR family transcriptional regulator [Bacteroidales bacterium]|nr:LytTR family transcriptional regulator [Bacteroidales bacterium]
MKRFLIIFFWIVSILLVSIVLTSVGYRFLEALFIGSMFLPGALAAKYFFPKVRGVKDTVFVTLGILVGEVLMFLIAHFSILTFRENLPGAVWEWPDIPHILTNPVFLAIILTALAAGSYFFESWLDRKRPSRPAPITFTSDRKPVTLPLEEILYVESNDDITTVIATGGRRFRNRTPISQWEAILGPRFLRIHRSYLVNKAAITRVDGDLLYVNDLELPISRKYKDAVLNACSLTR